MKRGTFIMGDQNSDDLKTYIQDRPLIETPLRKVDWRSAYGVDGNIPFDEEAYDNTTMELVLAVGGSNLISDRQAVFDMFDTGGRYRDFVPYFDPGKTYKVQVLEALKFENKHHYGNAQAASVSLTIKPYKYLIGIDDVTKTTKNFTILNPSRYVSQPRIRIEGTGDITVTVNGIEFVMRGISGHVVIDSERSIAFTEGPIGPIASENNKIFTREYPIFEPGSNSIVITGDVTKTIITPRWRSLV